MTEQRVGGAGEFSFKHGNQYNTQALLPHQRVQAVTETAHQPPNKLGTIILGCPWESYSREKGNEGKALRRACLESGVAVAAMSQTPITNQPGASHTSGDQQVGSNNATVPNEESRHGVLHVRGEERPFLAVPELENTCLHYHDFVFIPEPE